MIELRLTHIEHRLDDQDDLLAELVRHARAAKSNTEWLIRAVYRQAQQQERTMADLTALTADVTETLSAEEAAITLINGLADEIRAAGTDQAALDDLAGKLTSEAASLAAAVTANTPAVPAPEPEPQPVDGDGNPIPAPEPAPVDGGSTAPTDQPETPTV